MSKPQHKHLLPACTESVKMLHRLKVKVPVNATRQNLYAKAVRRGYDIVEALSIANACNCGKECTR
jgi:hypothetical protein